MRNPFNDEDFLYEWMKKMKLKKEKLNTDLNGVNGVKETDDKNVKKTKKK